MYMYIYIYIYNHCHPTGDLKRGIRKNGRVCDSKVALKCGVRDASCAPGARAAATAHETPSASEHTAEVT